MLRKVIKTFAWILGIALMLCFLLLFYVRFVSKVEDPVIPTVSSNNAEVHQTDQGLFVLGNNWFRKSESVLYELYVEGDPFERGLANGKLTQPLVHYQEQVFTDQIHRLVPNDFYLEALKLF